MRTVAVDSFQPGSILAGLAFEQFPSELVVSLLAPTEECSCCGIFSRTSIHSSTVVPVCHHTSHSCQCNFQSMAANIPTHCCPHVSVLPPLVLMLCYPCAVVLWQQ
jgi:hypothetical protein